MVSSAISGWIKNVLREAAIDTKLFKGHSTRSASTSKAGLAGLSATDILERGSWTNASTWQRFYNRQVEPSAEKYQNKVLSFEQEGRNGLEYVKRAQIVEYSIQSYGDFMK